MDSFGASAMDVECPLCHAGIDEECRPGTGIHVRGQPHRAREGVSPQYAEYRARLDAAAVAVPPAPPVPLLGAPFTLGVACPTCAAGPNTTCTWPMGQPCPPHPDRIYRATGVITEDEILESRARHLYETTPSAVAISRAVAWERLTDAERAPWLLLARVPPAPPVPATQETVDHPAHYGGDTTYEAIKVMEAFHGPEAVRWFCILSAEKYLSRMGKKPGEPMLRDLKKAIWYLEYAAKLSKKLEAKT